MRICLISRFFDLRSAGIGRYSKNLLKGLKKSGFDVEYISQDGGVPLGKGRLKYLIYTLLEIPLKIPPNQDIYHACSPTEAIWIANRDNSVVTFHDLIPILYPNPSKGGLINSIGEFVGSKYFKFACERAVNCKAIIAVSEQTAKDLVEHLGVDENRVNVVRQAIAGGLKPLKKEDDKYKIGTLSFLEPRKRIEILIKAFLEANMEDSELLIAGRGPQENKLKKISGNDERIKFLGFVPDADLCDFYNSLDVFVFPSLLEGYGLPIVEAMACGKPVITLADAVIPEDIKNRTFIVELSELTEVLKNRSYECDTRKNLEFAREHSLDKTIRGILQIYRTLLD
ncbi:MAG: glycosyltransferase family 4 protein [Methanothermobacter tenebrarum]|nr:glycosyltransferase family 4 protein [Methanobacteriales archaeon]NPV64577.1 glycosyltransferase family 4 protein [Methanobacteriaceae archaeon]